MTAARETRNRHAKQQRDVAAMATHLQRVLGRGVTALITGTIDPQTVGKWARGELRPDAEAERRLRDAYYVAGLLLERETPPTVQRWFTGRNPQLDDRSPALVIAEGHAIEVIHAAQAYLAGAW